MRHGVFILARLRDAALIALLIAGATPVLADATPVLADGPLDGRVFNGIIGPAENPDLPDSLHFNNGHFWSDICTRCGFEPGRYTAQTTEDGITFQGSLESETRGRFEYSGVVGDSGEITVSIHWEKKRWYWTARRDIVFTGTEAPSLSALTLERITAKLAQSNPDGNPMCTRF